MGSETAASVRLRLFWSYAQGVLALRRSDVLLASFPRSGSTWMRFVLAHLMAAQEGVEAPASHAELNRRMPELGAGPLPLWRDRPLPRVIKTHRPSALVLSAPRAVLLWRDPRDVMASYYHYELGKRRPRVEGTFAEFLRHPRLGVEAWCRHFASWRGRAGLVLRYEEMRAEPLRGYSDLLEFLGVEVDAEALETALARSSLERSRRLESAGFGRDEVFRRDFEFARSGTSGGWRGLYSEEDLEWERERLAEHAIEISR